MPMDFLIEGFRRGIILIMVPFLAIACGAKKLMAAEKTVSVRFQVISDKETDDAVPKRRAA